MNKLRKVWKTTNLFCRTKLKLVYTTVSSFQSCYTGRNLTSNTDCIAKMLDGFDSRCLRRLLPSLQIRLYDRITNEAIISETEQDRKQDPKKRRLTWFGHVARIKDHRQPRRAILWSASGKRRPGRPRHTWMRTLKNDLDYMGLFAVIT